MMFRRILHGLWVNRPAARRRQRRAWVAALHAEGLTLNDVDRLARYNIQVGQGIQHTANWSSWMTDLQERYNRAIAAIPDPSQGPY